MGTLHAHFYKFGASHTRQVFPSFTSALTS